MELEMAFDSSGERMPLLFKRSFTRWALGQRTMTQILQCFIEQSLQRILNPGWIHGIVRTGIESRAIGVKLAGLLTNPHFESKVASR